MTPLAFFAVAAYTAGIVFALFAVYEIGFVVAVPKWLPSFSTTTARALVGPTIALAVACTWPVLALAMVLDKVLSPWLADPPCPCEDCTARRQRETETGAAKGGTS